MEVEEVIDEDIGIVPNEDIKVIPQDTHTDLAMN